MLRYLVVKDRIKGGVDKVVVVVMVFVITVLALMISTRLKHKILVREVLADGSILLSDSRKVKLAEVTISPPGGESHERELFLLKEITKNVEVWPERVTDGYQIWIGCKNVLWTKDCKKGVLVNDALKGVVDTED